MNFEDLQLAPAILKAVREQGYDAPTPIQLQAIPVILAGKDLLAGAQTGTGKTAAFTLPMLHKLSMSRSVTNRFGVYGIRALVLTPTRELAAQVADSVRNYGKYLQLSSTVIFGGVGMAPQIERLRQGVDILVATPGRLLDLEQQGHIDFSTVQLLVLDEADRMLDMGFIVDVKKVLALIPQNKQSLLFSATFSEPIRALSKSLMQQPVSVQATPDNTTVQLIRQRIHPVGRLKKKALLQHIILQNNWGQVLVFTRTKFGANHVAEYLNAQGITAMALHGNKSQTARTEALAAFKAGKLCALVATDIAARGIDIDELPYVVNFDTPNNPEDYVHRIGRTGRAGSAGEAVSLVSLDEEGFMQGIEHFTQQNIEVQKIDGFGPDNGERAEPIAMGRQTLWGGLGNPPSREVMAAAIKVARKEMMERIRDKKQTESARLGPRPNRALRPTDALPTKSHPTPGRAAGVDTLQSATTAGASAPSGRPRRAFKRHDSVRPDQNGGHEFRSRDFRPEAARDRPSTHSSSGPGRADENHREEDFQPRANAHLGTHNGVNAYGHKNTNRPMREPDPTRTSIDMMTERRGGGGGGAGDGNRRRKRSEGGSGGRR